jgi:2-desacetyl-2-hydroxyethyl bacteriochlorophyllide A dehydrogenase
MKAFCVVAPGRAEIVTRGRRPLEAGEVRLGIEAVGICGSDVALWAGKHPYASYPVVPGHELGGRVLEASSDVDLRPGQRVTVRPILTCGTCRACREGRLNHCPRVRVLGVHVDGGMAEEVVVPAQTVFAMPANSSAEQGALVEPTAVAVHVCHRAGLKPGDRLAILGTGVIGLLCLQVAKAGGTALVLGVDREPSRLALASGLGADLVVDNRYQDAAEAGRALAADGFDVVLDTVGIEATLATAFDLAARGGVIVQVALPHGRPAVDFEPFYRKELTLRATRLYDGDFGEAVALMAAGGVAVDRLITHRFTLPEAARALALPGDHPEQAVKVIVLP